MGFLVALPPHPSLRPSLPPSSLLSLGLILLQQGVCQEGMLGTWQVAAVGWRVPSRTRPLVLLCGRQGGPHSSLRCSQTFLTGHTDPWDQPLTGFWAGMLTKHADWFLCQCDIGYSHLRRIGSLN